MYSLGCDGESRILFIGARQGNGTILMAKHTAMQSLNAFRKCHSCARVLDKERALVCLGCKDGLIASVRAAMSGQIGSPIYLLGAASGPQTW